MKNSLSAIFVSLTLMCCQTGEKSLGPVGDPSTICSGLVNWLVYQRDNIRWSVSYSARNTAGEGITKEQFLQSLESGKYFPVKIRQSDSSLCYQLYKLDQNADKSVGSVIKDKAEMELHYLTMEGKPFPLYNFVDFAGKHFDSTKLKDKFLIVNCWYINCQPCVEEFPALNKLVEAFKNRNDILFLGISFDSPDSLSKFLAGTRFNYNVLPVSEDYLSQQLGIIYYPTHIMVGKNGKIVTMTNELDDLLYVLSQSN